MNRAVNPTTRRYPRGVAEAFPRPHDDGIEPPERKDDAGQRAVRITLIWVFVFLVVKFSLEKL